MIFYASELIKELRKHTAIRVLSVDNTDTHPFNDGPSVMVQISRETTGSAEKKRLATSVTATLTSLATTRHKAEEVLYEIHLLLENGLNTEHFDFCTSSTIQEPSLLSTLPQGSGYQAVSIIELIYKEK